VTGRRLLEAAATYNAAWGAIAVVAPNALARLLGFSSDGDGMGWRAAGVVLLAYAPAYLWAADHPREARPVLATAVFGKAIGGTGWVLGALTGRFPIRTLILPVFNDFVWLPGLIRLLAAREPDRSETSSGVRTHDG
jgi:hypothetical protein